MTNTKLLHYLGDKLLNNYDSIQDVVYDMMERDGLTFDEIIEIYPSLTCSKENIMLYNKKRHEQEKELFERLERLTSEQ